jgi:hypothetical protein
MIDNLLDQLWLPHAQEATVYGGRYMSKLKAPVRRPSLTPPKHPGRHRRRRRGAEPSSLSARPGDEHGPVPKVVFQQRNRSAPTVANRELLVRKATAIFQRSFGGEPWVGREAPAVSTDDAVTQAVIARGL